MSLELHLLPAVAAVFLWWLATGLLVYLDGLPRRTFGWTFAGSTALAALGIAGLWASRSWTTPAGAAVAFGGAFGVWAWLEVSFYTGFVTGPPGDRCPDGCRGWRHLGHAVRASLYHEFALLVVLGGVWWMTRGAANPVGFWTLVVLLIAHQSARLNVLLGVPNVTESFLPEHMGHLRDFIGPADARQPLLPLATLAFSAVTLHFAVEALSAPTPYGQTAFAILAATAALAAAEHWALALPLRIERLWAWSLSSRSGR